MSDKRGFSGSTRWSVRLLMGLVVTAAVAWGVVLIPHLSPANVHVEAGIDAARLGQGAKAEGEWLTAIRLDPNAPRPWRYLAEYYFQIHDWPHAVDAFRHVARLEPRTPDVEARIAFCSLQEGDEQDAYRAAVAALKRNPNSLEAIQVLTPLLAKTGEEARRLELLRRQVALQPGDREALMRLASALAQRKLYEESRPLLDRLLQTDPIDPEALALRGVARYSDDPSPRGLASAEADLTRAAASAKYGPFARFHLGKIHKLQGKAVQALAELEQASRALPDKQEVWFELADACEQAHQPIKAAQARAKFEKLRLAQAHPAASPSDAAHSDRLRP